MAKYRVYDGKTGDLIVEGTPAECGAALGMKTNSFYSAVAYSRDGYYKKFRFEDISDKPTKLDEYKAAVAAWDDFVTPIRQRFGIPVRHLGDKK